MFYHLVDHPCRNISDRPRKVSLQPFQTFLRSEILACRFHYPIKEFAGASVQIWRCRNWHKNHGQFFFCRNGIQDMPKFLNDIPCQRMVDIQSDLQAPLPILQTLTRDGFYGWHAVQKQSESFNPLLIHKNDINDGELSFATKINVAVIYWASFIKRYHSS